MIPPEFISDLIERADLAEIIGAHVKLQNKGANWVGLCPFHVEKTPSFTVTPAKGFYHCFGCGAHGNIIGFLQQQYGMDFIAAVEKLAAMQGVSVPRQKGAYGGEGGGGRAKYAALLLSALQYFQQQLRASETAKAYLKKRGLTGKTAALYKIGYAPNEWEGLKQALGGKSEQLIAAGLVRENDKKTTYDYFRNRIIFPIIDSNDRVCGFGGRAMNDADQPKYLNSAENADFSKRRLLFGLPQAMKAARQKKRLIICEGYMDVVMLAQAGFAESVATMGTAATAEQMKKALRFAPNLYFAYDGDAAGQKGAFRALQGILSALKDGASVCFLFLPPGHDPDSYTRDNGAAAFEQLLAEAKPLGDYLIEALEQQAEAASPEGRATSVVKEGKQLLQLLDERQAGAWRILLQKKLEQHTGIQLSAVTVRGAPARRERQAPPPPDREEGYPSHGAPPPDWEEEYPSRPAPPREREGQPVYRMPPQSLLYNLLRCLAAKPALAEQLPVTLQLPGPAQEVKILNGVLNKLRWQMSEEEEEETNSSGAVARILEQAGYGRLARQLAASADSRFAQTREIDIESEFLKIVAALEAKHKKLSRPGKQEWLKKMRADRGADS